MLKVFIILILIVQDLSAQLYYCPQNNENGLTWEETILSNSNCGDVPPVQYCFKTDGKRLTRKCCPDGNNQGMGNWEDLTESCKIAPNSTVSPDLINLLKDSEPTTTITPPPLPGLSDNEIQLAVFHLSSRYLEFMELDVYLTSQFTILCTNIEWFAQIVSNVLSVNSEILKNSESLTLGLHNWRFLILQSLCQDDKTDDGVWNAEYFIYSYFIQPKNGISKNIANNVSLLTGGQELEDLLNTDSYEYFVWFNRVYLGGVNIFVNNYAFFPTNTTLKMFAPIFGVHVAKETDQIVLAFQFNETLFLNHISCGCWNEDDAIWSIEGIFQIYNSYFLCKFCNSGNHFYTFLYEEPTEVSDGLSDLLKSNATNTEILTRLYQISHSFDEYTDADVYLLGQVLTKLGDTNLDLNLLAKVVTNLQNIPKGVLSESQMKKSATDLILYQIDRIIQKQNGHFEIYTESFVILKQNLITFAGVIVYDNDTVEILKSFGAITDYCNVKSAMILSPELKQQFQRIDNLTVNIFFSDVLFNDAKKTSNYSTSKIFDVILPPIDNYNGPISIYQKTNNTKQGTCSHWLYDLATIPGFWYNDIAAKSSDKFMQCDYYHTTHFALLILDKNITDDVLDVITHITCALSILSCLLIIITAILFKSWRHKKGNLILLNFVVAVIFQIIFFYVSSQVSNGSNETYCILTGVFLHYFIIAVMSWTLVMAVLKYRNFVTVLNKYMERRLLKSCILAWGLPLLPIICLLIIDKQLYTSSKLHLCYPSGYGLYFGVWLPISLMLLFNVFIFILVINALMTKKSDVGRFGTDDTIYRWRLIVLLFFLLGLTWIFGFIAEMGDLTVFAYLFCIFATLQGFFIFVFIVIMNPEIRDLYYNKIFRNFKNNWRK